MESEQQGGETADAASPANPFFGVSLLQFVVSVSGITLNTLVLIVGLLSIKGSYRHYLSNLAVIDLLFSIGSLLMVIDFSFSSFPSWTRDIHRILCSFTVPPMSVALVPISVDRYLKVCRTSRTKLSFKMPKLLICLFVDFFPLMTLVACNKIFFVSDRVTNMVYMVIIPVGSLLIVLACNIALFMSISRHASVIASFENRRRINETQQLARATCIQAATPLFMQLPSMLGIFSIMGTESIGNALVWHLANLIWILMLLNPLVDAIVTLVVVKAYRRAVRNLVVAIIPRKFVNMCRQTASETHCSLNPSKNASTIPVEEHLISHTDLTALTNSGQTTM